MLVIAIKMNLLFILMVFGVSTTIRAVPLLIKQTRVVGGISAVISQYPSTAALLYAADSSNFYQSCVGTILTTKSIVSAAHCLQGGAIYKWRGRVGSNFASSGGSLHILNSMLIHPNFNSRTMDSDIAIIRTVIPIVYTDVVKAASIASASYKLPDNEVVWAVGFGTTTASNSEQLRHIQMWTVNQFDCSTKYGLLGTNITSNMVCAGVSGSGAQCGGDSGGPLFHNGAVVGIYSWGYSCANPLYPGINTRVSSFTSWIQANAS